MKTGQLQLLTSYSLLGSTIRIEEVVKRSKELGYDFLAITDMDVMYGVAEFYQTSLRYQIKPLIGLTITYQQSLADTSNTSLILLAKNQKGYENLIQISTTKMTLSIEETFTWESLSPFLSDLVVIIPDEVSGIERHLQNREVKEAQVQLSLLKSKADTDSLFGGIVIHEENKQTENWLDFLKKQAIPIAPLQDIRYMHPSDDFSLQILRHIDEGTRVEGEQGQQTGPNYLPTPEAMTEKFQRYQLEDALLNLEKIANQCQFEMAFHQTLLPHFEVPMGETASSFLEKICLELLPKRISNATEDYQERLKMELSVIHEMGFDDYFLIIWDVMNFAAENKIVTGAGRGSAAGSLVSYVLSITDVDPIKYQLLFERFLNKERFTMPDIDLDLPDNRREEVLTYVYEKYGENHVAQIATFGTMAAKMALRDVSRVFGLSQNEANQWSSAIPNVLKITLMKAFETSVKLQQLVKESDRNQMIFEVAVKLEGLPRHISTHAAGVVISDQVLTHYVPLQTGSNSIPLTQFAMGDVEAIGLLKMDFLGLRNLSILDNTINSIRRFNHEEIILNQIPMDDEPTLALFRKGQTTGIFQFESQGIRNVLRKLGPTSIEDVAAVNALYRPGPMDNIDIFIQRKKGEVPIQYPHESLKEILDVTYGVIVYQEQIMQVASKMAGFSLGQADILRRAISKKKKEVLDEERLHFVEGSLEQGYTLEVANEVYDYIERFANYGFNRSHAMAYSFIGYQMAYLKVHYPPSFFVALLHSVSHNLSKIKEYISEARRFGVKVKGPDINHSRYSFALEKKQIRFGFSSLKGIRRDFIENIILVRKKDGPYKSLDNFLLRIDRKWLKLELIEPLVFIGAFDSLHSNRKQLVIDLDGLIKNIVYSGGSMDLLSILSLKKEAVADYTLEEKLRHEEELLGTYLSGHPIDKYKTLRIVKNVVSIDQVQIGQKAVIFVYVKDVRIIRTKKGEQMAFLEGSDGTAEISVTIFPNTYREVAKILHENSVLLVEGKVERSKYNQALQIIGNSVILADSFSEAVGSKICYLKISGEQDSAKLLDELTPILVKHQGNYPVIIYIEQSAQKIALSAEFWVNESNELKNELSYLLGQEHIIFK